MQLLLYIGPPFSSAFCGQMALLVLSLPDLSDFFRRRPESKAKVADFCRDASSGVALAADDAAALHALSEACAP